MSTKSNWIKLCWALILIYSVLLAGCNSSTGTPTQATKPTPPATPELTQKPAEIFEESECPFPLPEGAPVECGYIIVPEDHGNPTGSTIRLATVILRDQSEDHQPDPVIILSGGPGEKAVANAYAFGPIFAPLHPNRDLILFDQRGVGLSEPALDCPAWEAMQFEVLDEPDIEVALEKTFDALMVCRDELVESGIDLDAYNTQQNAADVNAIRLALGYDQINLYGASYGSLLAQATARDYPETVRSVVIASVLPLEKSFFVDVSTVAMETLMRLVDACTTDQACNLAFPDLQNVLFDVVDRLNQEPLSITLTDPVDGQQYDALLTGDGVVGNLVGLLYQTQVIPSLPQAIYDVYNGDFELMTQLRSLNLMFIHSLSRGMTYSVMCTEDLIGKTPQDFLDVRAALPKQLVGPTDPEVLMEYSIFSVCEQWPITEADQDAKLPLASDIPTLVLEGEYDPVTPSQYGMLVAENLSHSYFFEFPGIGHNITGSSECALQIAGTFLKDPSQTPDSACIADMPGLVFDVPGESMELVLEPFADESRGFSGLVPAGWEARAPANLLRHQSALDPAYFVLEATPGTAAELYANLAAQLNLSPDLQPLRNAKVGQFTWDFYSFERGGKHADLAMAEDGDKAYFVFLISPPEEHELLFEGLFLPAVEAMQTLQ
jgi:pimeloyl-ACP methyl ester carboxylesterase